MNSDSKTSYNPMDGAIDRAILQTLQEDAADNDPEIILELLDIYIHDSADHLSQIVQAVPEEEYRTIELSAHSLKSSSATFGATNLSALFAEMEQLARSKTTDGIDGLLKAASSEFVRVRDELLVERKRWVEAASK